MTCVPMSPWHFSTRDQLLPSTCSQQVLLNRLGWALCDCLSGFVLSGERGHRGPLLVRQAPGTIIFESQGGAQGKKDFMNQGKCSESVT